MNHALQIDIYFILLTKMYLLSFLTSNCKSSFKKQWRLVFYGWHNDYIIELKQLVIGLLHDTYSVHSFCVEMTTVILLHIQQHDYSFLYTVNSQRSSNDLLLSRSILKSFYESSFLNPAWYRLAHF